MSTAYTDTSTIKLAQLSTAASPQASPNPDADDLDASASDTEVNRADEPIIINGDGTTATPDALSTVDHNDDDGPDEDGDDDNDANTGLSEDGALHRFALVHL